MARLRSRDAETEDINPRRMKRGAVKRQHISPWAVGFDEIAPGVVGDTHLGPSAEDRIREVAVEVSVTDIDALFIPLEVTFASVSAGGTISGSTPWVNRSLCNLVRFELSVDTELEVMLLRQAVFDSTRTAHKVFHAQGVGNFFMREGGGLFDYEDEDGGTDLHYWISNVGLSATVLTLLLNKRVPQ